MKKIFYPKGPPVLLAGAAGRFTLGLSQPVSDKVAEALLKKGFEVAGPDVKPDENIDQAAAEQTALAADKADEKAAKDKAKADEKTAKEKTAAVKEQPASSAKEGTDV